MYGQYLSGCLVVGVWEGLPLIQIEEVECPN